MIEEQDPYLLTGKERVKAIATILKLGIMRLELKRRLSQNRDSWSRKCS